MTTYEQWQHVTERPESAVFTPSKKEKGGGNLMVALRLVPVDLSVGVFFALFFGGELLLAALSLSSAAVAVCLFGGWGMATLMPSMPYWCGAVFSLSAGALAVLSAIGCKRLAALIGRFARAYRRFHRAAVRGGAPAERSSSAGCSQRSEAVRRRRRKAMLLPLILFAVCLAGGLLASMLSAGAAEFWHAWNWFI